MMLSSIPSIDVDADADLEVAVGVLGHGHGHGLLLSSQSQTQLLNAPQSPSASNLHRPNANVDARFYTSGGTTSGVDARFYVGGGGTAVVDASDAGFLDSIQIAEECAESSATMTSIRSFFATYEKELLVFVDWLHENGFSMTRDLHQLTREERFSVYKVINPPMQYSLQLRLERLLMLDRGGSTAGITSCGTQTRFKRTGSMCRVGVTSTSTQCNPYMFSAKTDTTDATDATDTTTTDAVAQDEFGSDHQTDSFASDHEDNGTGFGNQSAFSRPTKRSRPSMDAATATVTATVTASVPPRPKPHVCPACPQSFVLHSSLTVHYRSHTGVLPFVCGEPGCTEAFPSKIARTRHRDAHIVEKNFPCDMCGRKFKTLAGMKKHRLVHVEKKQFECEQCHRCFRRKDNLQVHRLTHSEEKTFACMLCGKRFRQRSGLAFHARTHEVHRPFKCGVCGRAFAYRIALAKHCGSVHE